MDEVEFVIVLTEHRYLGMIFHPVFIQKKEKFYTVERLVKPRDFVGNEYEFSTYEKEIVEIIERYSDERLRKKFSRAVSVSEFYKTLKKEVIDEKVKPFVEKCMGEVISIIMLTSLRLYKKDSKYANIYEEDEIAVPPFFAKPSYSFERTESETRYNLKVNLGEKSIDLKNSRLQVLTNKPCLIVYRKQLLVFEKLNSKKLGPFFEKDFVSVPNSIEEKYYPGFVLKTIRDYDVKAKGFIIDEVNSDKRVILSLEKDLQLRPGLVLKMEYGQERFPAEAKTEIAVSLEKKDGVYVFHKTARDREWEMGMIEQIKTLGLKENNGYYSIKGLELLDHNDALYFFVNWLNKHKPELEKMGISLEQRFDEKTFYTGKQKLELQTKTNGDWFDLYVEVHFGEFSFPFIRLKNYILNDIREFELPNGEIAILPEEWFARFKGLIAFGKIKGDKLQFNKYHFTLLKDVVQETDKPLLQRLEELLNIKKSEAELPIKLNATLRSYQNEGYNWMFSLFENELGGCLADDMGLGKTIQTLALLLKLKRLKGKIIINDPIEHVGQLDLFQTENETKDEIQNASLVVLPTSLVHNWENEIAKFTPSLKVYKHVGAKRKNAIDISKIATFYDVILTTYGTVRNDKDILSKTEFFYLILDESQSIKNSTSKTYRAIMKLKAKHKLVITGTPIENSLADLWSQMNFLNPGIFGSLPFFRKTFITPIEKNASEEQQQRLQLMIRPFVLRRKKDEVAKDLPPLMEQISYCPLHARQKKMYEKEKSIVRNTILANFKKVGYKKSSIVVLQGMTKLRQLANHPALVDKESEESSGKFEEIFRMLENLVSQKHKVLIFSSFVQHLELLQEQIEENGWKYSMLTGKTTKRELVIKEFQEDPDNHIFLISLKAGGVGLNLTSADYVFIADPWWNPAAENQAINRAHRIGQDKHVFVYRFITEDSIEEKIQKLKERKSSLADMFINSNDPFQEVTEEEILELFD